MRLERISAVKSLSEAGLLNSPEKIVATGPIELLKMKNIGRKSLLVIASLLQERGYSRELTPLLPFLTFYDPLTFILLFFSADPVFRVFSAFMDTLQ
ncbi:MAG: hypothetical protein KAJ10_11475 [Thermodesulfovibrionia bacterium]|nr:hypothetical protein [Thermodesulfovibrionia bacterium]